MFFLYTESYDVDGNGMESVPRDLTESQRRLNTEFEFNGIDVIYETAESLRTTPRGLVDLMGSLSLSLFLWPYIQNFMASDLCITA